MRAQNTRDAHAQVHTHIKHTSSTNAHTQHAQELLWVEAYDKILVVPGVASRLRVETEPAGFLENTPFQRQPIVQVIDWGDNVASLDKTSLVTVFLENARGAGLYSLSGLSARAEGGRAVFQGLRVDAAGADYQLRFASNFCGANTSSVCRDVFSRPFEVTLPGVNLRVRVPPKDAYVARVFDTQPVVDVIDVQGRVVNSDSGVTILTASLLPTANPVGGNLSGAPTVTCCAGVCKFTDLSIDRAHTAYTLAFRAPPFEVLLTAPFAVVGPSRLVVTSHAGGAMAGRPFVLQPQLRVLGNTGTDADELIGAEWATPVTASIYNSTGACLSFLATFGASFVCYFVFES